MTKQERIHKYKEIEWEVEKLGVKLPTVDVLDVVGFFDAPASTKHHGAYWGGVFDHSLITMESLLDMTERLELVWHRKASPYIVGLFHDFCKIDSYEWDTETGTFDYNKEQIIDGHGEKSVILLQRYLSLTNEEIACIRWHMGAFEKDTEKWGYYGRAIETFPNVLFTHTADMIASKIRGV